MEYTEEYIAQLILKHGLEVLTAPEKEALERWLSASAEHRTFFQELTAGSAITDLVAQDDEDEKNNTRQKLLAEIQHRIQEQEQLAVTEPQFPLPVARRFSIFRLPRWSVAAAVLLLIAGIAIWTGHRKNEEPRIVSGTVSPENDRLPGSDRAILTLSSGQQVRLDPGASEIISDGEVSISNEHGRLSYQGAGTAVYNTITTPKGGQYHILLSDGTGVWLNAASSIRYPTFFEGETRTVSVTGEAYFEVQSDKSKPFIVSTPGGNKVEVLGTRFNINAYEDESYQVTTLVEGRVKVSRDAENVLLRAGQQAITANGTVPSSGAVSSTSTSHSIHVREADLSEAVAWKNNLFIFNNVDLATIMRQLGRWYDFEVRYEGAIPDKRFQGKMPRDIPLSQVLSALKMLGVSFELKGTELLVLSREH